MRRQLPSATRGRIPPVPGTRPSAGGEVARRPLEQDGLWIHDIQDVEGTKSAAGSGLHAYRHRASQAIGREGGNSTAVEDKQRIAPLRPTQDLGRFELSWSGSASGEPRVEGSVCPEQANRRRPSIEDPDSIDGHELGVRDEPELGERIGLGRSDTANLDRERKSLRADGHRGAETHDFDAGGIRPRDLERGRPITSHTPNRTQADGHGHTHHTHPSPGVAVSSHVPLPTLEHDIRTGRTRGLSPLLRLSPANPTWTHWFVLGNRQ